MIVVDNVTRTIEPIALPGGVTITARQSPGPHPVWIAHVQFPAGPVLVTSIGAMPDDAVNDARARLVELRDTLVLACMDVASLPGCGGGEMMPHEIEAP